MRDGETMLRFALKPLDEALAHPATSEVVVHEPGEFGVEQDGYWSWHKAPDLDYDALEAIAFLAAYATGKDISTDHPSVASVLPGGQRIKAMVHPAVAVGTVGLAIRKRAQHFTPTLEWLAEHGYFELLDQGIDWVRYFSEWVAEPAEGEEAPKRRTTLVCGEIGSSKTTFAEALLRSIPHKLRLITIEGSPEWTNLPHRNWQPLYFDEADVESATGRVQDAMQLRPDWSPFQELRGGEAWAWKRLLNTGTRSIATVHASEARKALVSVRDMIRQRPEGRVADAAELVRDLRQRIGLVCHCTRFLPREREGRTRWCLTEVLELGETEEEDRMVSHA